MPSERGVFELRHRMITRVGLCEAAASGQTSVVAFLIDNAETDIDALGSDGVSPLCAATIWGHEDVVQLLLDAGCDPNVRNDDGTSSTALHAAAFQEHGKILHMLLAAGANGTLQDSAGRTACDFASISDALWPLFAARGFTRTAKAELIEKRVIRKVDVEEEKDEDALKNEGVASGSDAASDAAIGSSKLPFYSRPGSAYVRTGPSVGGSSACSSSTKGSSSRLPNVPEHAVAGAIDPLDLLDDDDEPDQSATAAVPQFSLWRE